MKKVFLNKATAMYILGYGTCDESRFDDLMLLAGLTADSKGNWADAVREWEEGSKNYTRVLEKTLAGSYK